MKDVKYKTCAVLPSYMAGDPVTIIQHMNAPIDIFGLRKYLERYKLNEWNLKIVKISNPVGYALAVDLDNTEEKNMDNVIKELSVLLNVDNTTEDVSVAIAEVFKLFTNN